jgi:hypothetical protein
MPEIWPDGSKLMHPSRPRAHAYLEAWSQSRAPWIGLSRFVFPAKDKKTALDQIGADVLAAAQRFAIRGAFPAGIDEQEALRRFHSSARWNSSRPGWRRRWVGSRRAWPTPRRPPGGKVTAN